jgi:hypothetical protein
VHFLFAGAGQAADRVAPIGTVGASQPVLSTTQVPKIYNHATRAFEHPLSAPSVYTPGLTSVDVSVAGGVSSLGVMTEEDPWFAMIVQVCSSLMPLQPSCNLSVQWLTVQCV